MFDSPVKFHLLWVSINDTIISTWLVMLILGVLAISLSKPRLFEPGFLQVGLEAYVILVIDTLADMSPGHEQRLAPLIGSLWLFVAVCNLLGLIPGLHSPTGDLSLSLALALVVFMAVPVYGVSAVGFRKYIEHYVSPNIFFFPLHVVSELSRTLALAVRLFGNIASLELTAMIVVVVAGLLVPVPLLVLHVVEGLVQAYIFGMLATVYVASGMQVALENGDSQ